MSEAFRDLHQWVVLSQEAEALSAEIIRLSMNMTENARQRKLIVDKYRDSNCVYQVGRHLIMCSATGLKIVVPEELTDDGRTNNPDNA